MKRTLKKKQIGENVHIYMFNKCAPQYKTALLQRLITKEISKFMYIFLI